MAEPNFDEVALPDPVSSGYSSADPVALPDPTDEVGSK